jgi:hypothetical protein
MYFGLSFGIDALSYELCSFSDEARVVPSDQTTPVVKQIQHRVFANHPIHVFGEMRIKHIETELLAIVSNLHGLTFR